MVARGCVVLLSALGVAACANEPISYIPPTDRALLEAQARMAGSGASHGPISVEDMLRQARSGQSAAETAPHLVLQFSNGAVLLDDAQKQSLAKFAAAARGQPVSVVSRPGGFEGAAALLGQRRAVAVARELSASQPDVELRFSADAPADVVEVKVDSGIQRASAP